MPASAIAPRIVHGCLSEIDIVAAIEATRGSITLAATALNRSKRHLLRLVARYGLNEWATELRKKFGAAGRGRPRRAGARHLFVDSADALLKSSGR